MRILVRLAIGCGLIAVWLIWISPNLSRQLHQSRALRSTTISIPTLRMAWQELESAGGPPLIDKVSAVEIRQEMETIREISLYEEQLITAIWAQIPDPMKPEALDVARQRQGPLPIMDSRYVDPDVPALIDAVISAYGYQRLPTSLPDLHASTSKTSRQDRLRATRHLLAEAMVGTESAARILDAAFRLSVTQRKRVLRERQLASQLPPIIRVTAARMHREGRHLNP